MAKKTAFIAALWVFACAGAGMKAYEPLNEKTKLSEDDLYRASVTVLEKHDYVAIQDSERFLVETREKEVAVSSIPRLSYKYTWRVQTREGTLSIESTCKENSSTARTEFKDCGEDRPERLIKEQSELRAEILTAAKANAGPDKD
jgi:hypothetical protein